MLDLVTRVILAKVIVTFPVLRRPNRSGYESAAAVRADVLKDVINARSAERALIGANPCFKRIGRQRLVAVLTRWSEFKHAGYTLPLFGMNLRATPLLHHCQRDSSTSRASKACASQTTPRPQNHGHHRSSQSYTGTKVD